MDALKLAEADLAVSDVYPMKYRWLYDYNHHRPNMALGGSPRNSGWPWPHDSTSEPHQKWGDYPSCHH